jgi:MoxR-like ATPase
VTTRDETVEAHNPRRHEAMSVDEPLADLVTTASRIKANIASVIEGKPAAITMALTVLLAEGHLLIEDVPGVGKTMMAKTLARSLDCSVSRIQFTPDLLPGDVTGVSVFNQESRTFEFRPGAVFANIVLADEINRASPKTQSALLECMEERQITVDTQTHQLSAPFMVVATQNPFEMEGTYPLPEAQRDRFMARISMGYPDTAAEMRMLESHGHGSPVDAVRPVADAETIRRLGESVRAIHASPAVRQYAVDIAAATRTHPSVRLGASPRATLHLLRMARATAAISDRTHVIPDDLQFLAVPVLAHRLLLGGDAYSARLSASDIVRDVVRKVPVPSGSRV